MQTAAETKTNLAEHLRNIIALLELLDVPDDQGHVLTSVLDALHDLAEDAACEA